MQPVEIEVDLPIPAVANKRYSHGRFISERNKKQIPLMAFGFRRCDKRDKAGKEYIVEVLVKVPSGYRCFVRPDQWESDDWAWLPALVALRINATAFAPFFDSGDRIWRVETRA